MAALFHLAPLRPTVGKWMFVPAETANTTSRTTYPATKGSYLPERYFNRKIETSEHGKPQYPSISWNRSYR
jgi:hypothetical protein